MKFWTFLLVTVLFLPTKVDGQALQKGDSELDLGLGFGIYSVVNNDYEDNSDVGVPGIIAGGISYQISNTFGLGFSFERNGFLSDPDSNVKAVSRNLSLQFLFNALNRERDAITLVLGLGVSRFRYDNFREEEFVISNGGQFTLGTKWKHFFSEDLGMYLKLDLASYAYDQFEDGESNVLRVFNPNNTPLNTESRPFEVSMVGLNFGFGLVYTF